MIEDFPHWTGPDSSTVTGFLPALVLVAAVIAVAMADRCADLDKGVADSSETNARREKALRRMGIGLLVCALVLFEVTASQRLSSGERAEQRFVQAAADAGYLVSPYSIRGAKPDARFDAIDPDGALVHCTSDIDYAPGKDRLHCTPHDEQPIATVDHDATREEVLHAIDPALVLRTQEPHGGILEALLPLKNTRLAAAGPDGAERTFHIVGTFGPDKVRLVFELPATSARNKSP